MLDKSFEQLKTFDWGSDPSTLQAIDQAVVRTHGNAGERGDLEERLLDALHSGISRAAQDYVFRKLRIVGNTSCVAPLAAMLSKPELAHLARYALESNPTAEAGQALRGALPELSGELKIGVISSLGVRQDDAAVPALAELLNDSDDAVANAAANALGAIRSSAASKALNSAKPRQAAVAAATDASLACAESLLASGNKIGALAVYKRLSKGDQPKHVKLAATRGMLACAGKRS